MPHPFMNENTSVSDLAAELSPLFRQLLGLRGLDDPEKIEEFLGGGLEDLPDPLRMLGMREACERISRAAQSEEKVLIHGDYDADGIMAATIMARTLGLLGVRHSVFLPERAGDGYGVSERGILMGAKQGASLLITVDCGITACQEIQKARDLGLDVIIVDHHHVPAGHLPPATAILNPLQESCAYPFKELSAAGLTFKLSQALLGPRALEFLDLVAVSTICDMVPLKGENRILVKEGLRRLSGASRLGFQMLSKVAGLTGRDINVGHVGFVYGPRINAAGRMSLPDISLRLFLTENPREAESLAEALHEENKLRQKQERQIVKEAIRETERCLNFNRDRVIVVSREGWHQGVIGIAASRLAEKYYRPAVVISLDQGKGRGSGRSIHGFDLYRALSSCEDLFEEFGGHAQAAGLVIQEKNIPQLRKRIQEFAASNYPSETFIKHIKTDLEIGFDDLKSLFMRELELLEPFGIGNPRPVFLTRRVTVTTQPQRLTTQTCQFIVTDGKVMVEAQCSGDLLDSGYQLQKNRRIDLAYTPKIKRSEGYERLMLEVKGITPLE